MCLSVCVENVFLSSSEHQQQREEKKSCSVAECVLIPKWSCRAHHVTSSLFILTALVFLLLFRFAFVCRFKKVHKSHEHMLRNDIRLAMWKKNSRAKNHYFTSRSSTFFFCSVRCFFFVYISIFYMFGQIHLTNDYARAYQWTPFCCSWSGILNYGWEGE